MGTYVVIASSGIIAPGYSGEVMAQENTKEEA